MYIKDNLYIMYINDFLVVNKSLMKSAWKSIISPEICNVIKCVIQLYYTLAKNVVNKYLKNFIKCNFEIVTRHRRQFSEDSRNSNFSSKTFSKRIVSVPGCRNRLCAWYVIVTFGKNVMKNIIRFSLLCT